jgi:hypothetical protein
MTVEPLSSLKATVAAKLATRTTAVAATVVLIGGGVAIAAPGGDDPDDAPDDVEVEVLADDDPLDVLAEHCATEEGADDPFCSGDSDTGIDDEGPDGDDPDGGDPEGDGTGGDGTEGDEAEDGARSDTADRVHRALTGGDELRPGDPGFGQAVAERARTGQLGGLVSRAARGEELSDEDLELEPRDRPGRGNGRPDTGADDEGSDDGGAAATSDGGASSSGADDGGTASKGRGGPPAHAGGTDGRGRG